MLDPLGHGDLVDRKLDQLDDLSDELRVEDGANLLVGLRSFEDVVDDADDLDVQLRPDLSADG